MILDDAISSKTFAAQSEIWSRRLTEWLAQAQSGDGPSLPWAAPETRLRAMQDALESETSFEKIVSLVLDGAHRLHSPRCLGHQVSAPYPTASLLDALASVTNQGGALYEMSPTLSSAERAIVRRLVGMVGWNEGDGFGTSGGTLANLTALLAARNRRYPRAWEAGDFGGRIPAVLVSEGAHYSLARAGGILGLGTRAIVKVPGRRLEADAVERACRKAREEGYDPFALVASSCSTSTGTFDPLNDLADVAVAEALWLHVDGAHGASALFSKRFRGQLDGVHRADSLTWDAHKMLGVPSLATFLLFRRATDSYVAFSQDAPYLFGPEAPVAPEFDAGHRTLECTRHSLSAGLFGLWSLYKEAFFEAHVDRLWDRARELYARLRATPDFVPTHEPEANILCFRWVPEGRDDISELQPRVRQRLIETGGPYLTRTRLSDGWHLRIVVMNPLVEGRHLGETLDAIRKAGREVIAGAG